MTRAEESDPDGLRQRAEELLARLPAEVAPEDRDRLLHELQVHQIELEMQNSELRHARLALEEVAQEYTELYDFAPVGYLTVDRLGHVVRANLTAARLLGTERANMRTCVFLDLVTPDDRPTVRQFLADTAAARHDVTTTMHFVPSQVPTTVLDIQGALASDQTTQWLILRDITTQHRLGEETRLLQSALEAAADPVVITSLDGMIVWANAAFTDLTGYTAADAIGKKPQDLVRSGLHEAAFYDAMWQTILAGEVWRGELTNRRRNGSLYPEAMTITPVKGPDGHPTHFIAVKRDLTTEKQSQQHLLQVQRLAGVGRLAGGIAHDFNNVLSIISGLTDAALLEHAIPEVHADLLEIREGTDRAAALTRQLLAFSRQQVLHPEIISLNLLITNLLHLLDRGLGPEIHLDFRQAEDLAMVCGDVAQLEQVVMNLVINARDAMPTGGVIHVTTAMREVVAPRPMVGTIATEGSYVEISVEDEGTGMSAEVMSQIFEPFFTTKALGEGTGLGLATVFGVVAQSGGHVGVESAPGEGARFTVLLPPVEGKPVEVAPVGTQARGRGERILVVDDEEVLRRVTARLLERLGYRALTAGSGAEALAMLADPDTALDLVLTDVMMPEMSGSALAAEVRRRHPAMPVIFVSGYADDSTMTLMVEEPRVHFLAKPYATGELLAMVRLALSGDEPPAA
jgi:PAS domain S-box-containing protein